MTRRNWLLTGVIWSWIAIALSASAEARTVNVAVPTLSMVVIAFTGAKEKG